MKIIKQGGKQNESVYVKCVDFNIFVLRFSSAFISLRSEEEATCPDGDFA